MLTATDLLAYLKSTGTGQDKLERGHQLLRQNPAINAEEMLEELACKGWPEVTVAKARQFLKDMSSCTLAFVTTQAVSTNNDEDRAAYRDVLRTLQSRLIDAAAKIRLCSHAVPIDAAGRALINWLVANKNLTYEQARELSAERAIEMAGADSTMKDFFISYNSKDKQWAEWIAWTLEAAGYTTVIQAWDFRAGGDFVMEMQKAATGTRKTIAVLTESYLRAEYTQPEWGNAFSRDPQGTQRTLVLIRVAKCKPDGLLATRIYIDLVGLSVDEAREKLIDSLKERGKPATSPVFPGTPAEPSAESKTEHPKTSFPGKASSAVEVWQEKLEFLRAQEPLAVGADQKFALKKHIEEAQQKIRELGGNP